MSKQKYSDEQLIEMINDSRYANNNQIVKALGAKSYGSLNNRLKQMLAKGIRQGYER